MCPASKRRRSRPAGPGTVRRRLRRVAACSPGSAVGAGAPCRWPRRSPPAARSVPLSLPRQVTAQAVRGDGHPPQQHDAFEPGFPDPGGEDDAERDGDGHGEDGEQFRRVAAGIRLRAGRRCPVRRRSGRRPAPRGRARPLGRKGRPVHRGHRAVFRTRSVRSGSSAVPIAGGGAPALGSRDARTLTGNSHVFAATVRVTDRPRALRKHPSGATASTMAPPAWRIE